MKQFFLLFCAASILCGCAGRDWKMPEEPDLLDKEAVEQSYNVNRDWWKAYADSELDRCVALALERNADLARSAITVNTALYRANQINAELVPSFSGSAGMSSRKQLETGNSMRSYTSSFGLSYEIDLWGRLRDSASAQEWEYHATESDRDAARLALINSVANTWYSIAYTKEALEISRETLKAYEKISAIEHEKYRSGKTDRLNADQSEQSVIAQKNSIVSLQTQLAQQEQTLRDLLDLRPSDALPVQKKKLSDAAIPRVDLNIPVSALGLRPDLKAAEYRIKSAFRSWNASRESLYPSITIGGTLGSSSDSQRNLFRPSFLNGLITLNLPFLDWNRVKWNVRISEEAFEGAKIAFRKALTSALNEVALYHEEFKNALAQLELARKKHETDKRIEGYRRIRVDEGADDLKYLLDAINASQSSRMSALNAKYAVIRASNAIFEAQAAQLTEKKQMPGQGH